MKYNELNVSSTKRPKRVGRGIGSGKGKTAGRGTKGQGSRTGFSKRPGFAGGQNPLMQRMPKLPGFTSHKIKMTNIFTSQLEAFGGKTVDTQLLSDNGLIASPYVSVKILHRGELTKSVTVKLQGASDSAIAAIQSAGGTFDKVERVSRVAKSDKAAK